MFNRLKRTYRGLIDCFQKAGCMIVYRTVNPDELPKEEQDKRFLEYLETTSLIESISGLY